MVPSSCRQKVPLFTVWSTVGLCLITWTVLSLAGRCGASSSNGAAWDDYYRSNTNRPDQYRAYSRGEPSQSRDENPDPPNYPGGPKPPSWEENDTYRPDPSQSSRRPPPPRPPTDAAYTPIHYQFRSTDVGKKRPPRMASNLEDDIPVTSLEREPIPVAHHDLEDRSKKYASPRKDAVTQFMSTKRGRVLLTLSSGTVGAGMGSFIGKSLTNHPVPFGAAFAFIMIICTVLRNPYGELSRALGLAFIFALQRTRAIRKRYPSWRHVKSCLGAGPRFPFPPSENPWVYEGDQVEFRMLYTVVAMAFVGSACGGNLPLIPTWLGALAGAGSLAFVTTMRSAQGDLARTMGMRVVSMIEEVISINSELRVVSKLGVVSGRILDKILILDRKHKVKDKMIAAFQWVYDKLSSTAAQVQSDMQDRKEDQKQEPTEVRYDRRDDR